MAVKIVCMHNGLLNLNLWISDLRNCWQLLITIGLHKIVSGGCILSGYSCYASKHKIIMGIVVLLTRDPQMRITSLPRKSISVVYSCKFSLNLITNVIAWLWNNQIWIVLSDNDWLFGYLMNVPGVNTAGRSGVMVCRSQTSWEGFPLSWK